MSLQNDRTKVTRLKKEIAEINGKINTENTRIARKNTEVANAMLALNKAASISSLQSKTRQLESKNRELVSLEKKVTDLQKRAANKQSELDRALVSLKRAEHAEIKKTTRESENRHKKTINNAKEVTRELERQNRIQRELAARQAIVDKLPSEIVVLFIASNPTDQTQLRLDEEIRAITQKIRSSDFRDSVKLVSIWATRPDDLLQALNEHKPTVVHFSGHGSEEDELILQDDTGAARPITKSAVVQLFKIMSSGIRLVVFNTCFSDGQAADVIEHIPAAIGMNDSIGDLAAREFSAQLYSAIGFGKSISESFEQAQAALVLAGIPESDTPTNHLMDNLDARNMVLIKPDSD